MTKDKDLWMTKEEYLLEKEKCFRKNWVYSERNSEQNLNDCLKHLIAYLRRKLDGLEKYVYLVGLESKIDFKWRIPLHAVDLTEDRFEFFRNDVSLGVIVSRNNLSDVNYWISSFRKAEKARKEAEEIDLQISLIIAAPIIKSLYL